MSAMAGVLAALVALPFVSGVGVGVRNSADWLLTEPLDLGDLGTPQRSRILAEDGSLIATFYRQNRVDVPLDKVAKIAQQAVLAIEDSRFYEHGALDAKGTLRALMSNLNNDGEPAQGGSGITQQYVKNLLLVNATSEQEKLEATETTKGRKVRELRYAIAVERTLNKNQILTAYLNVSYFGDGAYGIEAAAKRYFSVPASKLTLGQSATLAGLLKNPNVYNPRLNGEGARNRRDLVLDRMAEVGWISYDQASAEKAKPLVLKISKTRNGCTESKAPFFCDYVQREILNNEVFGKTRQERERLLWLGGLTIRTTLDWKTQKASDRAVKKHVPFVNRERKAAAQALVEPGTGEIKGMSVGRELGDDTKRGKTWINFAADATHGSSIGMPAGSVFKTFTLAAAFDEGMPIGERFSASNSYRPVGFRNCKGEDVSDRGVVLRNAGDGYGGRSYSLLTGTAHSVNTFFLKLEKRVGLCDSVKLAKKLGLRKADGKPLEETPSFVLGFNDVSPLRVAAAYAALAARGEYCAPIAIKKITRSDGKSIPVPRADCEQVIDKGVADATTHVLRSVFEKGGTARGLGIGRQAAGKTGTIDGYAAAWFAGYTKQLASAVWVGDPRGGYKYPMTSVCLPTFCGGQVYGASIPGPIWQDTMQDALRGEPHERFNRPPGQYFSKGSGLDEVKMPDLRGLTLEEASRKLRALDIEFTVESEREFSPKYKSGEVMDTDPAPGDPLDPGDEEVVVTLVISKGKDPKDKKDDPIWPFDTRR